MGIMGESKEPRSCWDGEDRITSPEDLSFHPDRYSSLQQSTLPIIYMYTRSTASCRHGVGWCEGEEPNTTLNHTVICSQIIQIALYGQTV